MSRFITSAERNRIKMAIIKELTHNEHGIFDKKQGYAVYNGTDLEMVVDCVQRALTKLVVNDG